MCRWLRSHQEGEDTSITQVIGIKDHQVVIWFDTPLTDAESQNICTQFGQEIANPDSNLRQVFNAWKLQLHQEISQPDVDDEDLTTKIADTISQISQIVGTAMAMSSAEVSQDHVPSTEPTVEEISTIVENMFNNTSITDAVQNMMGQLLT
jgi:hypothetical protein